MSNRVLITVELNAHGSLEETRQWVQRCFDYYHAKLDAKVRPKAEIVEPPKSDPIENLL